MDAVTRLLADIESDSQQHLADIEALELLLKVARLNRSRVDCGQMWLASCDGDLKSTKQQLAGLQKHMHEMLLGWFIGSVLKTKEQEPLQ